MHIKFEMAVNALQKMMAPCTWSDIMLFFYPPA